MKELTLEIRENFDLGAKEMVSILSGNYMNKDGFHSPDRCFGWFF
jgi:hypothetical protein